MPVVTRRKAKTAIILRSRPTTETTTTSQGKTITARTRSSLRIVSAGAEGRKRESAGPEVPERSLLRVRMTESRTASRVRLDRERRSEGSKVKMREKAESTGPAQQRLVVRGGDAMSPISMSTSTSTLADGVDCQGPDCPRTGDAAPPISLVEKPAKPTKPRLRLLTSFTNPSSSAASTSTTAAGTAAGDTRKDSPSRSAQPAAEVDIGIPGRAQPSKAARLPTKPCSGNANPHRSSAPSTPKEALPSTPPGARFSPLTPDGEKQCVNCSDADTPQWRGSLCNACALWRRARGEDRPLPLVFPPRQRPRPTGQIQKRPLEANRPGRESARRKGYGYGLGPGTPGRRSRSSSTGSDETVLDLDFDLDGRRPVHPARAPVPMPRRRLFVRVHAEARFWYGPPHGPSPRVAVQRVPMTPVSLATPPPARILSPFPACRQPMSSGPAQDRRLMRSFPSGYEPGRLIRDLPRAISAARSTGRMKDETEDAPWCVGLRIAKRPREGEEARDFGRGHMREMPEAQRLCASLERLEEVFDLEA